MMNFQLPWRRDCKYRSVVELESTHFPGVVFSIRKVSLGQRIDLAARVRELSLRNEFLNAGDVAEQMEAARAELLVERLYLEWGVAGVEGLTIDGKPATVSMLIEHGPALLACEISAAIKAELELSDDERKNY